MFVCQADLPAQRRAGGFDDSEAKSSRFRDCFVSTMLYYDHQGFGPSQAAGTLIAGINMRGHGELTEETLRTLSEVVLISCRIRFLKVKDG